jgi:UDP-N-acetylmuramate--alanine ligase
VVRVHFVGIGGYSMSGLAEVWRQRGFEVTGSDAKPSPRTDRLLARGIPVAFGHAAERVHGADVVVRTTDVPDDNPELVEARALGIPVRHRSELVAELLNQARGVAVTGTHGKTTTTTLIATLFAAAGFDPTVLLGGEVDAFGGSARTGEGPFVIAEADESDASFLRYEPEFALITNVEPEHLEHYGHDFQNVRRAFARFLEQVRPGGVAVLCQDDPCAAALPAPLHVRVLRYGLTGGEACARAIQELPVGHRFVYVRAGREVAEVRLPLPGLHNVQNAVGALALAEAAGVPLEPGIAALEHFQNAHRRFEEHYRGDGITVVDDYAHHPTEIRAVLAAARELHPQRIVALFQPQRYTRTYNLFDAFLTAFDGADVVFITDIYSPPGEAPIPGVSGAELARRLSARGVKAYHVPDLATAQRRLLELAQEGDLLLTMGAGDVYRVAEGLARELAARRAV